MPKPSLPVRLALLVAGTALPLIAFAAFIVFEDYQRDRADASKRVLETARGIRYVLDAEVQRITGGLRVLAVTEALRDGDFDGFRSIAFRFLDQFGDGAILQVTDRDGHELFSSSAAEASGLSPERRRQIANQVFYARIPQYSNLVIGSTSKRAIVTVEVPVFRDNEVIYALLFSPPIETFQLILNRQWPGKDWAISIFDREGINFARVPNPKERIGLHASPMLTDAMSREGEATLQSISLDGVPLYSGFVRSPLTEWTVAAGISQRALIGPLLRNLVITSVLGALLLMIGLGFAVRMATTIARAESLHNMLIEELNHRVKNTLAILQAIAVQTFRSASRSEREKFEGRLGALAQAHDLLSQEKWRSSSLLDIVGRVMEPYRLAGHDRVQMSGPAVTLTPRRAVVISMIVHEIATNAAKYGALSNQSGSVRVDWEILENGKLRLVWAESGGPPVTAPVKRGFGSRLIERSASDQLGGEATVDFLPRGVVCTLICPLQDPG